MSKRCKVAAVITLVLRASLIDAFKLSFPSLNSASGATSISWDPQSSNCSSLTIQHQCLPDKYSTLRGAVSDKYKVIPLPVDWLQRLIKNGTTHCQTVAVCEDDYPNVSTLGSIDVYLDTNGQGQPKFSSTDTGSGSSSTSNTGSSSATSGAASTSKTNGQSTPASATNSPTDPAQTAGESQTKYTNLGAILGGALGGVAALLLIVFLLLCWRRKARRLEQESRKDLIIDAPEPATLPTPFIPTSPSSPGHIPSSPRSGERFHIDAENVSPKARMMANPVLTPSEPLEGSNHGAPSSSRSVTSIGEGEDTRRQIMHLSARVQQLEAGRGDGQPEAAPPRYSVGA